MDIATMSIGMHQALLQNEVSISVAKLAMNSNAQTAENQIADIMNSNNMAIDASRGNNIDVRA